MTIVNIYLENINIFSCKTLEGREERSQTKEVKNVEPQQSLIECDWLIWLEHDLTKKTTDATSRHSATGLSLSHTNYLVDKVIFFVQFLQQFQVGLPHKQIVFKNRTFHAPTAEILSESVATVLQ